MTRQSEKLLQLLRAISLEGKRQSNSLVGEQMDESGLLDRAVLNRQLGMIVDRAAANPSIAQMIDDHLNAFQAFVQQGDVPASANEVCALLRMEENDLRRAALLSLMVRLAGKRKFDPIASYILENRAARSTGRA